MLWSHSSYCILISRNCSILLPVALSSHFTKGLGCCNLPLQSPGTLQRSSPSCQIQRESFTQNVRSSIFFLASFFFYALLLGADKGKSVWDLSTSITRILLTNFIFFFNVDFQEAIFLLFLMEINKSLRKDNFTSLWQQILSIMSY